MFLPVHPHLTHKSLRPEPLCPKVKCPECKGEKLFIRVTVEYAVLLLVPVFPTERKVSVFCAQCSFEQKEPEIDTRFNFQVSDVLQRKTAPKWTFTGLIFFIIIMLTFGYYAVFGEKSNGSNVEATSNDFPEFKDAARIFMEKSVREHKVDRQRNTFMMKSRGLNVPSIFPKKPSVSNLPEQHRIFYLKTNDSTYCSALCYHEDQEFSYLFLNTFSTPNPAELSAYRFSMLLNFDTRRGITIAKREIKTLTEKGHLLKIKN